MGLVTELNKAIEAGNERFQEFITQKLEANEHYLEQSFWMPDCMQLTVLNYLIQQHQEPDNDAEEVSSNLVPNIYFVLSRAQDKNVGEPVHYAISLGKLRLANYLLEQRFFDINRRNKEGRTLLSLALDTKNQQLLQAVLALNPNVHESSQLSEEPIEYQPLHQAILSNYGFGVRALVQAGAQLDNPVGPLMDTPLLLAARLGKINALAALLASADGELDLEAENNDRAESYEHGHNSVEALCQLLTQEPKKTSLIEGIAMLLCHGAEPPRREEMRQLLASKRTELLKAIDSYLDRHHELVDPFVRRCHLIGTPLHSIIYVDHSWGYALRQLFGRPSAAGLMVESWVTRKYRDNTENDLGNAELPSKAGSTYTGKEDPLKLYAVFVERYKLAYNSQRITNPWSTMNWMIAEGLGDWASVLKYSKEHPTSRTRLIINDMIRAETKSLHEDIPTNASAPVIASL
ncbi:Dot/Icm T4SS effector AnkC/LegA12 [Legionella saoudiensis]|uniref:Dot/Icm T4SS effector AnkC/LegA12 n=1 Tax=Legionella saoudiensis TaxID=1750561 RepID=UPI0007302424|nr:Dot/Icm T4SS effector AnkC/LegA12 [Legionella saoudiensis]